MKEYPSEHKKIVNELLDGKFIISPSPLFYTLQELEDEYTEFFEKSFNFKLNIEADFSYLSSNEVNEKRTRDFTLFLAILSRELDYSGKNFRDKIEVGSFDISETEELLRQSSKWEILEKTTVSEFDKFIKTWRSKNLIVIDGNKFKFTKAVKLFFTFAMEIAEEKLKEKTEDEKAKA
ncbi:hypothetical protein H9W90_10535 [Polaribacter pectinis]|uniref:Uncharacterized protein n=1 Tax=Polaribacter pectinis TaxID=2738844 RepID=A0A7G9L7N4_9FLAO|nr:hypothetical protein [Polaribacter pectinis]QNM84633.1 hypothetical protein H9W90_10535 [Polaribacter pectinis]